MIRSIPLHALEYQDDFLETRKNELLVSLHEKKLSNASNTLARIADHAKTRNVLTENHQKRLNQIIRICQKFRPLLSTRPDLEFNRHYTDLSGRLVRLVRHQTGNIHYVDLPEWESQLGLSSRQTDLVFHTATAVQLTIGCSHFCRRCNEWALPGVRQHFSFSAISGIVQRLACQNNQEIALYAASDPLDWDQPGYSLKAVLDLFEKSRISCSLLTKVPKGKTDLLEELVRHKCNLSVSVTAKNKQRISTIQARAGIALSKQHDTDDLLIPAGLDEDFHTVKPSITDGYGCEITPDGAFIIVPTFTSALHPFGHQKIPLTPDTEFFPLKKTGRQALLVDYFKPLHGLDLTQAPCCLDGLLDVQIESILLDSGQEHLTPPGMRSVKEYLDIFDDPARHQRKKMTLSVVRHMKQHFLAKSAYRNLSAHEQAQYRQKLFWHLQLCRKQVCEKARLHTLSFFLEKIDGYVQKAAVKSRLIRFLITDEINQLENVSYVAFPVLSTLEQFFDQPSPATLFEKFRFCVACLLTGQNTHQIRQFITCYPSVYDPAADLFLPKDHGI